MPLDPVIGGALIGTATGAGQMISAGIGNKKRIKAAKDAATLANERNIENWKRQNAQNLLNWQRQNKYNDPSAQMARLKAAGLNPNLVYGTGVQAAGSAGSVSSASTGGASAPVPNIQNIPIPDGLGAYQSMQQLGIMEAQRENIEANTEWVRSKTMEKDMSNWMQSILQNWGSTPGGAAANEKTVQGIIDGTIKNPAMEAKLRQMMTKTLEYELKQYNTNIASVTAKLHAIGASVGDSLAIKAAILESLEQGNDITTTRGIAATMNILQGAKSMVKFKAQ